jgi:multimeric flavodoxin WrbA
MKAVIFNGALTDNSPLFKVQKWVEDALVKKSLDVTTYTLKDETIAYCQGCFECWVKTPGECKTEGLGGHIAQAFVRSNICMLLTPITYGGYSSELKKAMDMLLCTLSPFFETIDGEIHHQKRYHSYPNLFGIGWQDTPNPTHSQIFNNLVHRNAINFHAPESAASVLIGTNSDEDNQALLSHLIDIVEANDE